MCRYYCLNKLIGWKFKNGYFKRKFDNGDVVGDNIVFLVDY